MVVAPFPLTIPHTSRPSCSTAGPRRAAVRLRRPGARCSAGDRAPPRTGTPDRLPRRRPRRSGPSPGGASAGWRRRSGDAGVHVPEPLHGRLECAVRLRSGTAAVPQQSGVTAVFVANDHMALGLLRAMHEAGRRVPEDVSVVGFDDIPEAEYLRPIAQLGPAGLRRGGPTQRRPDARADRARSAASPQAAPSAAAHCPPELVPDEQPQASEGRMSRDRYVVGVDYGTLSGRALVVRVSDGAELGTAVHDYRHARAGPSARPAGEPLRLDWALQVPRTTSTCCARRTRSCCGEWGVARRHHRDRDRLHCLHRASHDCGRHAVVPARRVRVPAARVREAVEAPRGTGVRPIGSTPWPHERGESWIAAVWRPALLRVAVRQGPAAASRRTPRSMRGPRTGSRRPTGSSGSCAGARRATSAPRATRASYQDDVYPSKDFLAALAPGSRLLHRQADAPSSAISARAPAV